LSRDPDPERPDPLRIEELFAVGAGLPAGERAAFLARECPNPRLHDAVASLLAAHDDASGEIEPLDAACAAELLMATELTEPERTIGPYRVIRTLGQGGMGTVFLAERVEGGFEQQVALKLVSKGMDSEAIVRRFHQERQILARLEHPGIARLLDGGMSDDGRPFFAMEYVDGEPITEYAERRALGVADRLDLILQICDAVQLAHRSLIVHRDLKPSNILVTQAGDVKLVDFGIAKVLEPGDESGSVTVTQVGMRALTPLYASPEQVRGEPVTTTSDVYALGVVLFELLTGRLPYDGSLKTREQRIRAVCETEAVLASAAVRKRQNAGERGERTARRLRGDLDAILTKALAKDRDRRYPSVEALAEDLHRHLAGQPVQARAPGTLYRMGKYIHRHRAGVALASLALAALLLGLAGTAWQALIVAAERDRTAAQAAKAEAVQAFLTSLLQSVDPYRTGGVPWTAEELLDRGVERIAAGLPGEPEVEAALLGVLGGVGRSLGQLERAEDLWRRSLAIRRNHFPAGSPEIAESLRGLAAVRYDRDEHTESAQLLEEALAIERRRQAEGSAAARLALAQTLEHLGVERHETGRLDDARALYEESLALYRALPDDHRAEVASLLVDLAGLSREAGDLGGSERLLREALVIERQALGDRHPSLAVTLGNLAGTLREKGDYAGAEPLYREALAISRQALGDEHPEVSTKLNNLAVLLRSRGEYAEAAELFRQVLALDRKLLGDGHVYVAYSMDNLGTALAELGLFDEAQQLFEGAHAILLETRGPASIATGTNRMGLAIALRLRGEPEAALGLLQEARVVFRNALGPGHWREIGAVAELAAVSAELGRDAEAEQLYREALEMRRRAGQAEHPEAVAVLVGLGRLLTRTGRLDQGLATLDRAVRIASDALPASHWRRDDANLALAVALAASGDLPRARTLANSVEERLGSQNGPRVERLERELTALREGL